jgi:hypothetical protein
MMPFIADAWSPAIIRDQLTEFDQPPGEGP